MKRRIRVLINLILIIFFTFELKAQTKIPKPPKPPKINFDFDFDGVFKMKPEEEKEIFSKLKTTLKNQLSEIKKYDKNQYFRLLRESQYKYMDFPFSSSEEQLNQINNGKIFELEVASKALVVKYQNSKNSDTKTKLKSQLIKTLNKLFELKEENRRNEVKELEEELKELRKSLRIRMENKDEIIKRRVQELLGEDDYLEWE